jgi:glycosyltransferase involved in cell wall biosynthesis
MNGSPWHVSVLIPACNEEDLLPRCLRSIMGASLFISRIATVDIVLAVDQSTDRTRLLGEKLLRGLGIVVCTEDGIVGQARAEAARVALERYAGPLQRCWLANTDADSCVPITWLRDQLGLAQRGVEAIAGTVAVDNFHAHGPLAEERFEQTYSVGTDGAHTHVHGANLGVRADVYLKAGGWQAIATAEDHDLWNRLREIGARRVSVNHTRVLTSGRRIGRAPLGFAHTLAVSNPVKAA